MAIKGKRTIYVGPAGVSNCSPLNIEGKAVAAIAPGTLLKRTTAGLDINNIGATVFGEQLIVADKDQQRGKSVDDAWTINENMVGIAPRSGEFMNILVAAGQALISGSPISRNGAGLGKLAVTPGAVGATSEEIMCYSDEIVTTAATQLVRVRVA